MSIVQITPANILKQLEFETDFGVGALLLD